MNFILRYKKPIALFFLSVLGSQLLLSNAAYALTTGPSQPEMRGFEPVGTTDMVDLFSGDFTYNIPLLDVGGYPVNMAYHSGTGMDDEASWVGLGWSLNPGAINRQLRGLPDDFKGDEVVNEFNMRNNTTAGLKLVASPEFFAIGKARISLNLGVFKNSYRGYGAELGVNATIGLTKNGAGTLTGGLNSNSQTGVDVSADVNYAMQVKSNKEKDVMPSLSVGSSYNSRTGIKGLTLTATADQLGYKNENGRFDRNTNVTSETFYSFAAPTYFPTSTISFNNQSYTLSGALGPAIMGVYGKLGFTGYFVKQSVANKRTSSRSYGFMYAENGKNDGAGLMDFNREKDMPYNQAVPYLPIPVPTYDLFNVSNQGGTSQYRVHRNGTGIFADPKTRDGNVDASLGVEVGAGGYFQAGVDLAAQVLTTRTNKWEDDNDYRSKGDFQAAKSGEPAFEPAYFKRSGERYAVDTNYQNSLQADAPASVNINLSGDRTRALSQWKTRQGTVDISGEIRRNERDKRSHVFSYLTAGEAAGYAMEKKILSYPFNKLALSCDDGQVTKSERVNANAKTHHISEVTTQDDDGKRYVYGIPVYNQYQEEVSFSVNPSGGDRNTGLVSYSATDAGASNNQGREAYYSKEILPAFAHSYLLTGVLSADYADLTGDGISDDDAGEAIRFHYSKQPGIYRWRTPYDKDKANFNENMRSDTRDDRGSYVYGEKETWYTHSIESKDEIALFITKEREDAIGVLGNSGGKDDAIKQRYLEKIELYSKQDLQQNGTNAVPVKTVHFEYDYSSCPGIPNNTGKAVMVNGKNINSEKGKLTLKRVYFTYGKNGRGILNAYKFSYRQQAAANVVSYQYKQADRWGMYKSNTANEGGLNNDEFPYSTQDKSKADEYAALWQLEEIETPGSGTIRVGYESDDYAYVQDKRAQQMCFVKGIDAAGQSSGLIDAKRLLIKLPQPVSSLAEMKARYFEGMRNLYFRLYVNLDNAGHYEYIPGYGTIQNISMVDDQTAAVELNTVEGAHPAALASWQFLRTNLPLYAYGGSETVGEDSDFKAAIKSLLTAVQNLSELAENFNAKSRRKKYGNSIDLSRSWVRLCSPGLAKLGGGSRVKSIRVSDNWKAMSGAGEDFTFGEDYNYTTTTTINGEETTISSGVATYEPMIGNDENPFRQPITYTVKGAPLGLNDYSYMEAPLGENFFPAADVGYSRVTVNGVGADNKRNLDGFRVNEFYTAKDFPTLVDYVPINPKPYKPNPILNFLKMKFKSGVVVSQGYTIEVNDMHGKKKKELLYKRGASGPMSSTEYLYKTDNSAGGKRLQNDLMMLHPDGTLRNEKAGVDVEVYTDMREQYTQNIGGSLKFGMGSFPIAFFPGFYGFPGVGFNQEYREFRSTSTVKLIQRSGIQYKVIKIENGSAINTEDIAWDAQNGQPLLNKTQNEFGDPVYNLSYPAYWAYDGMGPAYKNIGVIIKGFSTDTSGRFLTSVPADILLPGDEVVDISGDKKSWVMKGADGTLRMIDINGAFVKYENAGIKIVRSGRRNMMSDAVGQLTALRYPIKAGKIDISVFTRVIDAKMDTYKEEWPASIQRVHIDPSNQQEIPVKCPLEYLTGLLYAIADPTLPYNALYMSSAERKMLNEQYIFAGKQSNVTLKSIISQHRQFGPIFGNYPLSQYFTEPFFKSSVSSGLKFYVNHPRYRMKCGEKYWYFKPGDTITIGSYIVILKNVHPYLNDAINGYPWLNSDGTTGYYTGNQFYNTKDTCGCSGTFGYGNTNDEKIELAAHQFIDISIDGKGCDITSDCPSPMGAVVNPYVMGMLGNWRPWQEYSYLVDRDNTPDVYNTVKGATDIRNAGYFSSFQPFWTYTGSYFVNTGSNADPRWIVSNEVTKYHETGVEIERKNAVNLYTSSLTGYGQHMVTANGYNAQEHEIAYDGFEDYDYVKTCGVLPDSCKIEGHFDFKKQMWYGIAPVNSVAHTGKYSLKISKPVTVTRTIPAPLQAGAFSSFDNLGRFVVSEQNTYPPFYPSANKAYVASVWVKGAAVTNTTSGLLRINVNTEDAPVAVSQSAGVPVEGWRKVEVQFLVPENAGVFTLTLDPQGGDAYFDDIRIHPLNGVLQSFVFSNYDGQKLAELDENNYATIYEYDDEGQLVRVKKETERGMMTVKEVRTIIKKRN